MKIKNKRLEELQGVLLKLLETTDDEDEIEFIYSLLEKVNNKLGE